MDYSELMGSDATDTEKRAYLVDGETTAITIRIPKNLKETASEAAALKGVSFSAYVRMCLINDLLDQN